MNARRGFTLIELLVVMGIIAVLMGLIFPVIENARHQSYKAKCANNLRQLGMAVSVYANENAGSYPRTRYTPGVAPVAGTGAASPDPFAAGGPQPNDVTAAVYLLRRTQATPAEMFICPYNDVTTFEADAADPQSHSNFSDYRKNLGYSFANPYPDDTASRAGYGLNRHVGASFAVAADLNPGTRAKSAGNSRNHEDEGQNVLYGDGHVTWEQSPLLDPPAGTANRSIYFNRSGQTYASPADPADSVLLPAEQ
jgi:prepilin-type N-terminal cleavage/methylation domain-containing protein/prepilin-type processing-associated H-X9-DG protein